MEFIVEEDLVVGTMPMVPLEALESFELFGSFSVLKIVFLRLNSLKKGIVAFRCLVDIIQKGYVSLIASEKGAHSWRGVCSGIAQRFGRSTTETHAGEV